MDDQTVSAYDEASARYAREWNGQPPPDDMYALLRGHFRPGPTIDVGCGAGRDAAWLRAHGFEAVGVDASEGLLAQARLAHPEVPFAAARLPELAGIARGAWENVLCETVLMHLDPAALPAAARTLRALLRPGGTLYASWRVTRGESVRDPQGRLYAVVDREAFLTNLGTVTVLFDREDLSASSAKPVHRLIVRA